jgi:hypothetical protein
LIEKLQRCFVTGLLFGCEIFYLGEAFKTFFFDFCPFGWFDAVGGFCHLWQRYVMWLMIWDVG